MAKYKIIPSSRTIVHSPISIGHKAEKGVVAIEFDLTAWVETYGSGTLTVIMRRWGDAIPYPIALEIGEDNKATWTLSDIDTAKAGMAYAQLNYIVGDEVVKKSDIYTFRVMDSLTGEGEPPEAYESWLEHLTHLAAEAMAEVLDIEGIVTDKTLTVDGGIADAKAAGDDIAELENKLLQEINTLDVHNNYYSHDVLNYIDLSDSTGQIPYGSGVTTIYKHKNVYDINGTIISNNTRIALTGSTLSYVGSQPTYERVPEWYVEPIPGFVIGHDYLIVISLIDGTYEPNTEGLLPFLTLRDKENLNKSFSNGMVWTCTSIPEMVCFVLRNGTYTNTKWYIAITDLTEQAEKEGNFYYVPKVFETQLQNGITKINNDLNDGKTAGTYGTDMESFIFITDVHWSENKQHSPGLIKQVIDGTPVQMVMCGGDFIHSHADSKQAATQEIKDFTNRITQIPCYEYYAIFGNHDSNSNSGADVSIQFTKDETFNLIYSSFAYKSNVHWIWDDDATILDSQPVKADYYVDHPLTKTRYLCIDWNNPMNTSRINWLQSVLSKDDGYRVVVFYHGIYASGTEGLVPEHIQIMSAIEPYKGKVVAVFTGHAHLDDVIDYYGDGSVPVIITSCDTFRSDRMTAGTLDEQCFDVAVIDYANTVIKLTRFGRGSDRQVSFTLS